jgi:hypothetical protein
MNAFAKVLVFFSACVGLMVACTSSGPDLLASVSGSTWGPNNTGPSNSEPVSEPARRVKKKKSAKPPSNPLKNVYFGDTHAHSELSGDAYGFGNRLPPENAYRLARGEEVDHVGGYKVKLKAPLDFFMMTDHSEMIGIASLATDKTSAFYKTTLAGYLRSTNKADQAKFLYAMQAAAGSGVNPEGYTSASTQTVWNRIQANAEQFNEPGKFTTFIAYEWTSMPQGDNLHRNVIFRGTKVADLPFSAMDSAKPEHLWSYLEEWRAKGADNLAISHNGNLSNGRMFSLVDSWGAPLDAAYAGRRNLNEPLHEAMQLKGTSMTHPSFSPNDEWANFEILPVSLHTWQRVEQQRTSYVREAYKFGLQFQQSSGFNPFKFGLEGGGDDHGSAHTWEEFNYHGGHAGLDATPKERLTGTVPLPGAEPRVMAQLSAGGITGVWAESNTRDAIFDALRRKETFGSSGVRIAGRFFGSFEYPQKLTAQKDWLKTAYAKGVPMGGDLTLDPGATPKSTAPTFAVHALRDPNSAPLQRIQIIKGWTKAGELYDKVFDVACSDGGKVDPKTHRCPDNGAKVNIKTCEISKDKGDAELAATWTDPEFDMTVPAFYYVRVLENPVCRWSTRDANRLGVKPLDIVPTTIQERIWTSPIWYTPVGAKPEGRAIEVKGTVLPSQWVRDE